MNEQLWCVGELVGEHTVWHLVANGIPPSEDGKRDEAACGRVVTRATRSNSGKHIPSCLDCLNAYDARVASPVTKVLDAVAPAQPNPFKAPYRPWEAGRRFQFYKGPA